MDFLWAHQGKKGKWAKTNGRFQPLLRSAKE